MTGEAVTLLNFVHYSDTVKICDVVFLYKNLPLSVLLVRVTDSSKRNVCFAKELVSRENSNQESRL